MNLSGSPAVRWTLPVIGAGAILLLLIAPIGLGTTALAHALENTLHAPLFALIAVGLLVWLRHVIPLTSLHAQYWVALLLSVALGALGELAQSFTSTRHAEWIDLANDLLGATAGLAAYCLIDKQHPAGARVRRAAALAVVISLAIAAAPVAHLGVMYWQRWRQLPELATWDSRAGYHFVTATSAALRVTKPPIAFAADGRMALLVSPRRESRWVGVSFVEPWPRWGSYARLSIEVMNPNASALDLFLRINDRAHNNQFEDRFNRPYVIAPRERVVLRVPLTEVQLGPQSRRIDLNEITQVILFQDAEQGAQAFYLYGIRLEN
jgi:hypothetical protein